MKYGIISYNRPMRPGSTNRVNIGDPIQQYAIHKLYERMGILEEEIIEVDRYTAKSYDGEYVLLPFSCFNMIADQYNHKYDSLPPSPRIIPVYISFHLHSRVLDQELIDHLKAHQPIGCRDEETMINLRRHGIIAYLSGCATITLPRRTCEPKIKKTFFVDAPKNLMPHVPKEIMENAEMLTHMVEFERSSDELYLTEEEWQRFYEYGIKRLEQYRDEATLVVTSRLHVASPCIAMGIPVIVVANNFDGRFSWIDKYTHLYTDEEFDKINWEPQVVEIEEEKQQIADMFMNRIKKAYENYNEIYSISQFYENRERKAYNTKIVKSLESLNLSKEEKVKYCLWGIVERHIILATNDILFVTCSRI